MRETIEVNEVGGGLAASERPRRVRRYLAALPVAVATIALAAYVLHAVLEKCGHPAVPLDDAFIHFQYAKRLSGGHFFSYVEGEGYTSGATSLLWPALLAPFYALGFRDLSIVWVAWFFGFLALSALAIEAYRLAAPLAGHGAAIGAAAMVLCFGGYVWCAASGMEVVPLAWALAFALRRCIEWCEASADDRSAVQGRVLLAIAFLAPLLRPEGMIASFLVFGTLALAASQRRTERRLATLALAGPLVVPAINLFFTGRAESSTVVVKWLPGNPYYGHGSAFLASFGDNVRTLFVSILDGREWGALFIPAGARPIALAALAAIPAMGILRRRALRSVLVLAMALAMLVTCTYATFLWNRLRYLWPFAFAWFVGLACLARSVGELFAWIRPRFRVLTPLLSGALAGSLATHLGWTTDDLASSASAIDRQQVALGRWAADQLGPDARIGVNDVGAISYFGGRKTFDIVGLTTPSEAPYWVAGAGSRFEHYEQLARLHPGRLPTHFIVYPHWMACDAVLGEELHAETVVDQTILGGTTMTAYVARYGLLGSGNRPMSVPSAELFDELDVADLESEGAHRYELGEARDNEDQALLYDVGDHLVADGARLARSWDRFFFRAKDGHGAVLVLRLVAEADTDVEVRADGVLVGSIRVAPARWTEGALRIPAAAVRDVMAMLVRAPSGTRFGAAHYWLYGEGTAASVP
jgi:hypothetical protein